MRIRLAHESRSKISAALSNSKSQSASSRLISSPARTVWPKLDNRAWAVASNNRTVMVDRIRWDKRCARVSELGGRTFFTAVALAGNDRKNDVVLLLLELQDQLHSGDFVQHTEVNSRSRTEEIHRFSWIARPGSDVLKIKAGFFLLNQNPHSFLAIVCFNKPRLTFQIIRGPIPDRFAQESIDLPFSGQ